MRWLIQSWNNFEGFDFSLKLFLQFPIFLSCFFLFFIYLLVSYTIENHSTEMIPIEFTIPIIFVGRWYKAMRPNCVYDPLWLSPLFYIYQFNNGWCALHVSLGAEASPWFLLRGMASQLMRRLLQGHPSHFIQISVMKFHCCFRWREVWLKLGSLIIMTRQASIMVVEYAFSLRQHLWKVEGICHEYTKPTL